MPSQRFPQSEEFNCVFQLIKHQHHKSFHLLFHRFIPLFSSLRLSPPFAICPLLLFLLPASNTSNKSVCFFLLFVCLFNGISNIWRLSSWMENLMVVYSGASARPSHLFQLLMRRCGIYCNLRSINSYLFRLSLRWHHSRTYSPTNTH